MVSAVIGSWAVVGTASKNEQLELSKIIEMHLTLYSTTLPN
mgnify:CR=1 FL=1